MHKSTALKTQLIFLRQWPIFLRIIPRELTPKISIKLKWRSKPPAKAMKTISILVAVTLSCAPVLFAAPPAAPKAHIEVIFDHPEKFTDVKDSDYGTEKGRDGILGVIKDYLVERAPRYLSEGQTLTITFKDIDLAGDFEPWRGPDFSTVRIVKDIYPPRMNFTYKLVDANGAVVQEGEERLLEMAFQMTASPIDNQDSLRYEKAMLNNWLRDKFSKPKKATAGK